MLIRPAPLKEGDAVALVCPASPVSGEFACLYGFHPFSEAAACTSARLRPVPRLPCRK